MLKKIFFLLSFMLLLFNTTKAQYLPIYHQYSQQNNWYKDAEISHTALQPIYVERNDTMYKSGRKFWLMRKILDEHLVQINRGDAQLKIDFIPDVFLGRELSANKNLWNNTRGFRFFGTVAEGFSYDLSLYENQAVFPTYLDSLIRRTSTIPGQGWMKSILKPYYDYAYAQGHIAYRKNQFHFQLGNDKLFIGDGYRSLLLSDVSVPYPYFRATYENKKFQYSAIYMQHIDLRAPQISADLGFRRKWAVMHYLNWNIGKKFTLGLFDALVWQDSDSLGQRGFEMQYANPIIFLRTAEYMNHSSDNALIGINLKYDVLPGIKLYSQFALDELKLDEYINQTGWWANKYALQLGLKFYKEISLSANTSARDPYFTGTRGNLLVMGFTEMNTARPYMYTHKNTLRSYTNYNDALAHPLGANFVESVSRLELQYMRWGLFTQINYARYGLDSASGTNVGSDIFASYNTRDKEFDNRTLQGIRGSFLYADVRASYLLNPKVNARLEIGYIYREAQGRGGAEQAHVITFGVRAGWRNLYMDR